MKKKTIKKISNKKSKNDRCFAQIPLRSLIEMDVSKILYVKELLLILININDREKI